ncbi:hypothetical protein EG831_05245 [bacterium]|nr:hypothetical protein [bacterium]
MRYVLIAACLAALVQVAPAQTHSSTNVSYAVCDSDLFYEYRLTFWKDKDSLVHRGMQFRVRPLDPGQWKAKPRLADCVPAIGRLWDAAAESVAIDLRFVDVGYPAQFPDVLRRQIAAFAASPEWKQQLKRKKPSHDFRALAPIMAAGNVYGALDPLLQVRGYRAIGISTEKHGYLRKEDVAGLDPRPSLGGLRLRDVPLPFIVTIGVARAP